MQRTLLFELASNAMLFDQFHHQPWRVAKQVEQTLAINRAEHTGQVIGGVAPVGHPRPLRTLVDTALKEYAEVWAAGGVPQAVFPTTHAELLRITSGTPAEVA